MGKRNNQKQKHKGGIVMPYSEVLSLYCQERNPAVETKETSRGKNDYRMVVFAKWTNRRLVIKITDNDFTTPERVEGWAKTIKEYLSTGFYCPQIVKNKNGDYTQSISFSGRSCLVYAEEFSKYKTVEQFEASEIKREGEYIFLDDVIRSIGVIGSKHLRTVAFPSGMCIFENCYGLVYARVESEITRLSNENFAHCTSLKTVELPDNLVEIGGCQFFGCTSLEYIKIPDTVKVIGERSFNNCTSLVELDLPASLTELEISSDYYKIGLVYNCPALERIIIRSEIQIDLTELNKSYQYGTRCDIYIADELLTSYQQTYPNMRFFALSNLM